MNIFDKRELEHIIDKAIKELELQNCTNIIYDGEHLYCYITEINLVDAPCGQYYCPYYVTRL